MVAEIFQKAGRFASANSPAILTTVGVVGVVTTAGLAAKGAFQASEILRAEDEARIKRGTPGYVNGQTPKGPTIKEQARMTWVCYAPAAGMAVLTCGAIIFVNRIGGRRTAAMAAAFTLSDKALHEYREKVIETIGVKKERRIRDDVMQDRVANKEVPNTIIFGAGKQPCYDAWSDRYFSSTMEDMKKAMNDLNHKLHTSFDNQASLNEFYDLLGIAPLPGGNDIGWTVDKMLDIEFTTCLTPDQIPAHALNYRVEPTRNSFRR